jgi:hypothetical protein
LLQKVPQQVFIAAKDLGGAPDCEDVSDCRRSSSRRAQVQRLPFPWQQFMEPALQDVRDAVRAAFGTGEEP